MKVLCILACFVLTVSAFPIEDENRINGENGWYVPQRDGSFEWIDLVEAESKMEELEIMEGRGVNLTPVTFYLYTASSPNVGQEIIATSKSILKSNFNPKLATRFLIHGWLSNYLDPMNKNIRNAWFMHENCNIIVVDWARARSTQYASSVSAVPPSGKKIADMINFLVVSFGVSLDDVHLIGHSLGAHVAGYAGKNINNGQVNTIVGLDPALPLFSYNKPSRRLASTDAFYVESIQTNGGNLGFLKPIGKGAFYPNGGRTQPGCLMDSTGSCAHSRSVTYYIEAVEKNDFPTIRCGDYEDAVANLCGASYSNVRMGAMINAYMVAGDYYVPVHRKAPFGMGN